MKTVGILALLGLGGACAFSSGGTLPSKTSASCLQMSNYERQDRRAALGKSLAFVGAIATGFAGNANALDMDAFMNAELDADVKNCDPKRDPKCKPKLSEDEALCQYGQGGEKKREACKRVKAKGGDTTQKGGGKSLGGAYAM